MNCKSPWTVSQHQATPLPNFLPSKVKTCLKEIYQISIDFLVAWCRGVAERLKDAKGPNSQEVARIAASGLGLGSQYKEALKKSGKVCLGGNAWKESQLMLQYATIICWIFRWIFGNFNSSKYLDYSWILSTFAKQVDEIWHWVAGVRAT